MSRLSIGARITPLELTTMRGDLVKVPDGKSLVHLQFRRFAGCPVCNLHLRSFVNGQAQLANAGLQEIVFFHSSEITLKLYEAGLPFHVIADPQKRFFRRFKVEAGPRALLDPRAYGPVVRAIHASAREILRGRSLMPRLNPEGGRVGLPADFLIDKDGEIVACKYGSFVYDQWRLEEVLELARAALDGRCFEASSSP